MYPHGGLQVGTHCVRKPTESWWPFDQFTVCVKKLLCQMEPILDLEVGSMVTWGLKSFFAEAGFRVRA